MTINNHEIFGCKILVKLEQFKSNLDTTEAGIITPLYSEYETEGGRPASKIRNDEAAEYSTIGAVVQIPKEASEFLKEKNRELQVGEYVSITPSQVHPMNQFLVHRDEKVSKFEGYLLVHPDMIQSKLKDFNGIK